MKGRLLLGALPLFCAGCAPTVVATAGLEALQSGTTAFIHGELESAQLCTMDTVYAAALDAMDDMQFTVVSKRKGEKSAGISAREQSGRSIQIDIVAKSPIVTKTNIRVGFMGDQVMSRLILGEIQARCPAIPTVVTPEKPK